jgi:hypothetical protein
VLANIIVDYLKSQIETGDPARTKKALQEICKHYRDGYRVHPNKLVGLEQSVVGLLYTQASDEKVRRWALNTLARLGREPQCMEAVMHALKQYDHEPQTSAAAIAAIFRMSRKARAILQKLSFDEQMVTLAALQHVDVNKLDLSALPIDVETASPDLLKLALVVVGLDRAPENMMHPRHENSELVKALGGHHDNVVAQYTVWAITENPSLNLIDLGIDIKLVEDQPANVRAWIYRLIAMTAEDAEQNFEYVELGSRDPIAEARSGLALGLGGTYFDGLEALVIDWFINEPDSEVSQHLLDHMIRQSEDCASYSALVLEIYEKEPTGSSLRKRMETTAAGTILYSRLRQIDRSDDLFGGVTNVTNNTFNIKGGVQGGAVSLGGEATNVGSTAIHYNPQTVEAIQSQLSKLEKELHASSIEPQLKENILRDVQAAKADPTPDKISKVTSAVRLAGEVVLGSTAIWEIGHVLAQLAGLG